MIPGLAIGKIASTIGIKGFAMIGLGLALAICWWGWSSAADKRDELAASLKLADAEIALLKTDAGLKETAAKERQADTAAVAQAEKELIDAIAEVPDSRPDDVRVRLGCERLRKRAGSIDADLPAVCRPGSGNQASPAG